MADADKAVKAAERGDLLALADCARDGSLEAAAERWHDARERVKKAVDGSGKLSVLVFGDLAVYLDAEAAERDGRNATEGVWKEVRL